MITNPVKPITVEVAAACDLLESAIYSFLGARNAANSDWQYGSSLEAYNLLNLVVRQIEGVFTLAREDLVLLPAAFACARAGFETAAKTAWMVDSDDPFVREARWLAHLQSEEQMCDRISNRVNAESSEYQDLKKRAEQLKGFRLNVSSKLPEHVAPLRGLPKMDEMLKSFGGKDLYFWYILLSQYVHGTHEATWLYRKQIGPEPELGEYIDPVDWYLPLRLSWICLTELGGPIIRRLNARKPFLPAKRRREIFKAIERIKE